MYYVYFIRCGEKNKTTVKIGITGQLRKRLCYLQVGNPYKLKLNFAICLDNAEQARKVEKIIHHNLRRKRLSGEWFSGDIGIKQVMRSLELFIAKRASEGKKSIIYKVPK